MAKIAGQTVDSTSRKRITIYVGVFLVALTFLLIRGWLKKKPSGGTTPPVRTAQTKPPPRGTIPPASKPAPVGGAVAGNTDPTQKEAAGGAESRKNRSTLISAASIPEALSQDPFILSENLRKKYDALWGTKTAGRREVREPSRSRGDEKARAETRAVEEIKLQATLLSPVGNVAILNGEEVSEGDRFLGYTVKEIRKWSVILEKSGRSRTIEYSE